ncbi:MAG: histidine--tRNA ligase [Micavibrio sp.]|nr:histidine--tRNA ligase [Micavibrio sp.]|tara:strand:- start:5059 stop:6384 length:1326 start_codon:yes stop_codon:yes gene_type:complete
MSNKIYKPKSISGFPEWLPEVRLVEQQWFDHIRRVFESYGYCNIETPSVEELDVLRAKGEVDKEIYVIDRLHKEEGDKEGRLALHFDQTVPFARYTAQHFNDLVFPFKRYQMQRVWRGERPQAGRFREFYQCDIDVINVDNLPISFDAEMPAVMWEILTALPGMQDEKIQIRISNRKVLLGYIESLNVSENIAAQILAIIDKIEKIGAIETSKQLNELLKNNPLHALMVDNILSLTQTNDLKSVQPENEQMKEGLHELITVMDRLKHLPEGAVVADLSIVRGLDYYTGTVYETVFLDDPNYGSICSGGRYDDLAGSYINKHLPGVGISIGFSRLFARMVDKQKLDLKAKTPAQVLVVIPSEEQQVAAAETAQILRKNGHKVELYHAAQKLGKQLGYAEKKGIPFVWFVPSEKDGMHQLKDMYNRDIPNKDFKDPSEWKANA